MGRINAQTPPARLGRSQGWARMSSGSRPTLAGVFLSSLAVIPQVKSALSPKAVAWRFTTSSRLRLRPSKLTQADAKTTPCRVGRGFPGATAPQRMHPTLGKVFLCLVQCVKLLYYLKKIGIEHNR